jgi:hypothetical protein
MPGLDFDFDPTVLIVSMIPSAIGFVLFTYGRKEHRAPQFLCGVLLMIYPYFTPTLGLMFAAGISIIAALYVMLALGW